MASVLLSFRTGVAEQLSVLSLSFHYPLCKRGLQSLREPWRFFIDFHLNKHFHFSLSLALSLSLSVCLSVCLSVTHREREREREERLRERGRERDLLRNSNQSCLFPSSNRYVNADFLVCMGHRAFSWISISTNISISLSLSHTHTHNYCGTAISLVSFLPVTPAM